jgi:ATP-dependent DNA helicase RecG
MPENTSNPVAETLQAVIPPLRYAARDQFAKLHTLKGFEELLADVCKRATRVGLPAETAARIIGHARGFERMSHTSRINTLKALVRDLRGLTALPAELEQISVQVTTANTPAERKLDTPAVPSPSKPTNTSNTPSTSAPSSTSSTEGSKTVPAGAARRSPRDARRFGSPHPSQQATAKPSRSSPNKPPNADEDADEPYASAPPKVPTLHVQSGPLAMPLKQVARVHSRLQSVLTKKGLIKAGDVLYLMPRVYEDRRKIGSLAQIRPGERGSAIVEVRRVEESFTKGGKRTLKVIFGDHSGTVAGTYFHGGNWLKAKFPLGKRFLISGELRASSYGRDMAHPEAEPADDWLGPGQLPPEGMPPSLHFERIVPVYPGFERGEQRTYRELVSKVVGRFTRELVDPLPEAVREQIQLPSLPDALRDVHFPQDDADVEKLCRWRSPAHRRLAFDELFFSQLGLALRRHETRVEPGIAFDIDDEVLGRARSRLPFKLTGAQSRVLGEIASDMARREPMNRLLQGDVGSGKTAVALCAALVAIENGYQAAVMAPTEILAEQHANTLRTLCSGAGIEVGLFVGSSGVRERKLVRERLAQGRMQLAVGTHALLEDDVRFAKLGLVVIDEQHRFGVLQRARLMAKGTRPDVLVMTATPIPRTLAMAAYGDLDLSIIDEMPPGRTPIVTTVHDERRREDALAVLSRELAQGRQAYVIYPLVAESERLDLESATEGARRMQASFPQYQVGLLHGRMNAEEKEAKMRAFRDGKLQLLVSTTVVEVGVDVPNATVMLVESAERFGLAQLHQLRGRVGRGSHSSFCLLVTGVERGHMARERLAILESSCDGFVIAEKDLELRGPGEFLGVRQSGLPELAVANLARDQDLLALAQKVAQGIVASDALLMRPEHRGLRRALEERWEGKLALAKIA